MRDYLQEKTGPLQSIRLASDFFFQVSTEIRSTISNSAKASANLEKNG